MDGSSPNLGVSLFANRLYYALSNPDKEHHLLHIGSYDFNFDVVKALSSQHREQFPHVKQTFEKLLSQYEVNSVRALTYPTNECWTALPKIVYDNPDEREDHLSIIMKGVEREDLEPTWHTVSKSQYKFLNIRRRSIMGAYDQLSEDIGTTEFVSDFELAQKWSTFNKPGGSFLMIGCHKHVISVTSYVLGKFRASTYIKYDHIDDIPYMWLQQATHSTWMKGLHESTFFFGIQVHEVEQMLKNFLDKSTKTVALSSLGEIGVYAEEQTYSFELSAAFPAILLAIDF